MKYSRRDEREKASLIKEARGLRAQGLPWYKIAKELNIASGTLSSWRDKNSEMFNEKTADVVIHQPQTIVKNKKTMIKTPHNVQDRAIIIVTTTNNISSVLGQL